MKTIPGHPDMGFYAEVWSYTKIQFNDGGGHNGTCGLVNLDRASFAGMPDPDIRDLVLHESLHSFNCMHNAGYGAFDEGSAIFIFKAAFPQGRHAAESFAEATYGTKLYYRDFENNPDYPMAAPDGADAKALELYRWLSQKDNHHLPWNSTDRLQTCFDNYYKHLNRNVGWDEWMEGIAEADANMAKEPECRPV